jgi:hypothetical protein
MLCILGGIAAASARLTRLMNELEKLDLRYRQEPTIDKEEGHVIVTGDISLSMIESFCAEFFHQDHQSSNMIEAPKVVIFHDKDPSPALAQFLVQSRYGTKLMYYRGSFINEEDLENVQADIAKDVFILNHEANAGNGEKEDSDILVAATMLRDINPTTNLHVQVHKKEACRHLKKLATMGSRDFLVCTDEIHALLLALNVLCPGICTLIDNLFTSFTAPSDKFEEDCPKWLKEYYYGCGQEIYSKPTPSCLIGVPFTIAADAIFNADIVDEEDEDSDRKKFNPCGVVLIGIQPLGKPVLVNPGKSFNIPFCSQLVFIADDESEANSLMNATTKRAGAAHGAMLLDPKLIMNLGTRKSQAISAVEKDFLQNSETDEIDINISGLSDFHIDGEIPVSPENVQVSDEEENVDDTNNALANTSTSSIKSDINLDNNNGNVSEMEQVTRDLKHLQNDMKQVKKNVNDMKLFVEENFNKVLRLVDKNHLQSLSFRKLDASHEQTLPNFKNHIMVVGPIQNPKDFIASLKKGLLFGRNIATDDDGCKFPAIVLLNEMGADEANAFWSISEDDKFLPIFKNVYHVTAHVDPKQLEFMNIADALVCVVIVGLAKSFNNSNLEEKNILTTYLNCETALSRSKKKRPRLVIKVTNSMHIRMIGQYHRMFQQKHIAKRTRSSIYASISGHRDKYTTLNTIAQAKRKKSILLKESKRSCCSGWYRWLMHHHSYDNILKEELKARDFFNIPIYASGECITTRSSNAFLCHTMYTPQSLDVMLSLLLVPDNHATSSYSMIYSRKSDRECIRNSHIAQLSLNGLLKKYQNEPYKYIFDDLIRDYEFLPIALYRTIPHYMASEMGKDFVYPYVYTSPSHDVHVRPDDCVFVILPPKLSEEGKELLQSNHVSRNMYAFSGVNKK